MGKVIAIANQKGGVAKTTTASSFAAGLKDRGYKVLVIDLDAQGNLSDSAEADENRPTVYEIMKGSCKAGDAIQQKEPFDLIASKLDLAAADMEFTQTGREYKIKKALATVKESYDYIVLDTPPALGIMTANAFMASDEVIIPVSGIDSLKGINNLFSTIETMREYGNPNLKVAGILLTMYDARTKIDQTIKEVAEQAAGELETKVFSTFIRRSKAVDEAKATSMDIFSYNEKNNVAIDYSSFIDEYLKGEN